MDAKTLASKMETYKIWAPDEALWTEWAKPVLFASVPTGELFLDAPPLEIPQVSWLPEKCYYTMIIVDLPGKQGIQEGLALAQSGYRPVPLYNGVIAPNKNSSLSIFEIASALYAGANVLRSLSIVSTAPPAFLLDYDRMSGVGKVPGSFDNRWSIFPQDMPSAAFLSKRLIKKVIVRSSGIKDDLAHVLRRYQEQKISISLCDGSEIKATTVDKPSRFKSLFYRLMVIMGLTRNSAGGFGGVVPEASSGGG
jgi:hypothetical protein